MPLCFDCHAEVGHYNDKQPRGTKFRPDELRAHRDRLFKKVAEGGPLVFDALAGEAIRLSAKALADVAELTPPKQIDLTHDAKVARYLRYSHAAQNAQIVQKNIGESIRLFESALAIAEADESLSAYEQVGHYHMNRLSLWECYLLASRSGLGREYLRRAISMGMDENSIAMIFQKSRRPGGIGAPRYYNLLLQEYLCLFDEEIGPRTPYQDRLTRISHLMDLIENPYCADGSERMLKMAKEIEQDVRARVHLLGPEAKYDRPLTL